MKNGLRIVAAVLAALAPTALWAAPPLPQKEILICASEKASPAVKQAADDLAKNAAGVPVLKGLMDTQGAGPVVRMSSEDVLKQYNLAAFNHLVVIGLKSQDPLVDKVWEHYASVDETNHTFYAQGWGWLQGDIGYIESDRNPFLHSRRIKEAPFEAVIFKITGTSEAGVVAACKAFSSGLLNGFVPAGKIERPKQTLLDLDPLTTEPPFKLPASVPMADMGGKAGTAPLVGWTQVPANEYRAYIDMDGFEPSHIWRYKYLRPGIFEKTGTVGWMAGFHRMAYGNSVNVVEFPTADEALKTARAMGQTGGWHAVQPIAGLAAWQRDQPTDENMPVSLGKVTLIARDQFLLMSTLPMEATVEMVQGLK